MSDLKLLIILAAGHLTLNDVIVNYLYFSHIYIYAQSSSLTLKGFFFTGRKGKGKKEASNGTSDKPFKRSLSAWLKRFTGLWCCAVVLFFSFLFVWF